YGLSEECNSRKITALEWADVVIQLSDYLNVCQFSIIAQSVGTVFALAIVHKYKKRILGPIYLISPWVSTQAANTFKWTRRLPAPLVAKTISLALDVMWVFNKSSKSDEDIEDEGRRSNSSDKKRNPKSRHTILAYEEDELLASLDDDVDLTTDFPTNRPLRHFVRPKHMSLYLAMNKRRMSEAYSQGQLCDLMVALEKYHSFGFNYSDVKISVSAVWGDKDGLIPQKAIEYLANSLHDVRLKILESEGHDLVWKEGVMEWALRGIAERHTIDCFIPNDSKQYFILSHVHKDHAHGLENPNFKEKVYCTEQTALLLPFMEKHTSKQFMYSHLEGLMVSVPYFETILRHNSTKITFLPANHNLDYLKGFRIKNLYMDTTCCYAEKRNFISKVASVDLLTQLIQTYSNHHHIYLDCWVVG
ncbi:hypothetical protein INT48_000565, partial [Thamnidium elegans]